MKEIILAFFLIGQVVCQKNPYLEMESKEIDSDEHGVGPGVIGTTCNCGWSNRVTSRIVGGRQANTNQFPFIVGIMPRNHHIIFCGGTIISEYHVLTAAHCFPGLTSDNVDVVVGEHSLLTGDETNYTKVIQVANLQLHPEYNPKSYINDIALITLAEKITFNRNVGPACLPTYRGEYVDIIDQYVKVLGWGTVKFKGAQSSTLLHVNLRVIPLSICKDNLKKSISLENPTQICTFSKNKDSCQGDSGGPVIYLDPWTNRYALVGIVSYGYKCASPLPAISTEVAAYLDWISHTMEITQPDGHVCGKL